MDVEKIWEMVENALYPNTMDATKSEPNKVVDKYNFPEALPIIEAELTRWIPVGEPPKKDGYYLGWRRGWVEEVIHFYQGKFDDIGPSYEKPTHWMPIPTKPESPKGE